MQQGRQATPTHRPVQGVPAPVLTSVWKTWPKLFLQISFEQLVEFGRPERIVSGPPVSSSSTCPAAYRKSSILNSHFDFLQPYMEGGFKSCFWETS